MGHNTLVVNTAWSTPEGIDLRKYVQYHHMSVIIGNNSYSEQFVFSWEQEDGESGSTNTGSGFGGGSVIDSFLNSNEDDCQYASCNIKLHYKFFEKGLVALHETDCDDPLIPETADREECNVKLDIDMNGENFNYYLNSAPKKSQVTNHLEFNFYRPY